MSNPESQNNVKNVDFEINQDHAQIGSQHFVKTNSYVEDHSVSNNITINNEYLNQMPQEYAESLKDFVTKLNEKLNEGKIDGESLKKPINQLANAATSIGKETDVQNTKKTIREKLKDVGEALARMSPKIAVAVAKATPLSPFADLIGESLDKIIQKALPQPST